MLPIQPDIEGRQTIKAIFENYFKQDAAKLKHIPLETQVAGNWAYAHGNLAVTVTPKSGKLTEEIGQLFGNPEVAARRAVEGLRG